jgi:N-acetylmuramic acid 6-phosphate etherase
MLSAFDQPPAERPRLDELPTEAGGESTLDYDVRSTVELVELMNDLDDSVPAVVRGAAEDIGHLVDAVADRLARGGRLMYVGAGSSGRIAAVDAAECESTFSASPGQVVALVAGGAESSPLEQEVAEDDREAGTRDLLALGAGALDAVVCISASGRTPYVLGAAAAASSAGALTGCIVCVPESELARGVDHAVTVVVGPEFLAGSTRLKAGTAQKLVLNTLSTLSMLRLGKTYGNLMVDVVASNEKLRDRVRRIVQTATGADPDEIDTALAAADGRAKVAIVSLLAGIEAEEAKARLDDAGGNTRRALEG